MMLLRPLGFKEKDGVAYLMPNSSLKIDLDDEGIQGAMETRADVLQHLYYAGFHEGRKDLRDAIRKALGL